MTTKKKGKKLIYGKISRKKTSKIKIRKIHNNYVYNMLNIRTCTGTISGLSEYLQSRNGFAIIFATLDSIVSSKQLEMGVDKTIELKNNFGGKNHVNSKLRTSVSQA